MAANLNKRQIARRQAIFLETFEKTGGNITQACKKANIHRQSYYNWLDKYDDFADRVMVIRESLVDYAESKLMQAIKDGNLQAVTYYLNSQGKHRGYGN